MDASSLETGSSSPIVEMLTPRSKVAKMLADIDNAPTPSPARRTSTDSQGNSFGSSPSRRQSDARRVGNIVSRGPFHLGSESESDDESDDMIRKPQGRMARRMHGHRVSPSPTTQSKRRIFPRSSPPSEARISARSNKDEEDLYSATPMRPVPTLDSTLDSARSGALFVSPARSLGAISDEENLPLNPFGSKEKLAELVAKKRQERLRRELNEAELSEGTKKRKHHRSSPTTKHASSDLPEGILEDSQTMANPDIERILSDASRPTRKVSKKALLEMERETQRLTRQQALAHQMKVKKKFTTQDLFAKFNFRREPSVEHHVQDIAGDTSASSAPNSDAVESISRGEGALKEPVSTPPSSPPTAGPTPLDKQTAMVERGALSKLMLVREDSLASLAQVEDAEDLPDIRDVLKSSGQPQDVALACGAEEQTPQKRDLMLARLAATVQSRPDDSSDEELDIIAPLPSHLKAFDRIVTKPNSRGTFADTKAIHNLRHLSNMGAYEARPQKPGKPGSRRTPSVNPQALEQQLRMKAKEQARQQQLERIAELKAKGVEILTTEDREKEQEVFESLLEKARQDAQALRQAEKAASKVEGSEGNMQVSEDEDEDEEYIGSEDDDDDEGMADGEEDEDEDEIAGGDGFLDKAAEVLDEDEDEEGEEGDAEEDHETLAATEINEGPDIESIISPAPREQRSRRSRIVADDDEEEEDTEQATIATTSEAENGEDDPFAAFNFNALNSESVLLSPTQAFKATMQDQSQATQDDSFDILRRIAPPSASMVAPSVPVGYGESQMLSQEEETQISVVPGSQSQVRESQRISLDWDTQAAPETPKVAGLTRGESALSETPGWQPTQDAGMPSPWTRPSAEIRRGDKIGPVADDDRETQDTVLLRVSESPENATRPARGRLVRKRAALIESDSDDETSALTTLLERPDAFREMTRRRKQALNEAERAQAEKEAKGMMDEQAEESEDEYAGLGGDDFVAPETEQDREMIDSSHVDVDERALAAHFAERERVRQEEETSKLYKDLTTGALRRKQANMFDLGEDDDEMAVRRRQMRQREETRKRKLLLQDDKIAGLAQGKQSKAKDAFLKAIADDDGDDELLNDTDSDEDESVPATQEESQPSQQPAESGQPLREVSGNKRRLADDERDPTERPAAKARRIPASAFRKPASFLEIQESLSFLLDEPDAPAIVPRDLDDDTESEDDTVDDGGQLEDDENDAEAAEDARQNDGGFAPNTAAFEAQAMPPPRLPASQRRTAAKPAVVDRLSLKRGSSTSDSDLGRTAWAAGPTTGGFKVPSLLRRATTNIASAAMANDRGVTTPDLSREGSGVKMGGTKKSSLAYQARAEERRVIVEASARRRAENTAKIAQMRRNSSMMSKGLTGRFE